MIIEGSKAFSAAVIAFEALPLVFNNPIFCGTFSDTCVGLIHLVEALRTDVYAGLELLIEVDYHVSWTGDEAFFA